MEKNMSGTIAGDVLCDIVSGFLQGSLLYRRNRRSAWRSDRFVDPAESNNRSANRNVDDLD